MSTDPAPRKLPEKPDLQHLKGQAKDLLRSGGVDSLADAQFRVARSYGFPSWPKLKTHIESLRETGLLKEAIDSDDFKKVKELMWANPKLHSAAMGYGGNGPLTWVAECRGAAVTNERLDLASWMIENGSDVHQGGDGPLMRAALSDERIPMMERLVGHGADVHAKWDGHYPILCAPCETLQPRALEWLLERAGRPGDVHKEYLPYVQMLVSTYSRNSEGKHACLEVFSRAGFDFPDTAPMAIHLGRIDRLASLVDRDPGLLTRHFRDTEIFPAELGIRPQDGLHCAPLNGATLLHMAVEYQEPQITEWLIDRGANVNARTVVDDDGFGGHTPLFHTTVTLGAKTDLIARLLVGRGADVDARATFRKQLQMMGDPDKERMTDYHEATPVDFAHRFQEPRFVNKAAVDYIVAQSFSE